MAFNPSLLYPESKAFLAVDILRRKSHEKNSVNFDKVLTIVYIYHLL